MCILPVISTSVNQNTRYKITATAISCGNGWTISICGGTHHHIGAVTVFSPNSLETPIMNFSFPGHKDEFISYYFAKQISQHFHCNTVASAGIHIDNATKEEIHFLIESSKECCAQLMQAICTSK